MNKKVYYNLTQIDNGWLLSYPKYLTEKSTVAVGSIETYHKTLTDTISSIHKHFQRTQPCRPAGNEGDVNLLNGKEIKISGILKT